jgi:sigma-B regulation protein RsbU (phosphoserine phosphatase)
VGGDYLDVREMHAYCWSAIVAEISGKGVGAALLASLMQGMFLAAPFTKLSMEEMMFRVNRFLNDRTGGEQYATVFYCTVEASGVMHWVNAGHPRPLLMRASGQMESVEANGLPVGMLEDSVYQVEECKLQPGDKIVVYSDGITEARNGAGEFFGVERMRSTVRAGAHASCQELHAAILDAVEEFTSGALQDDDMSLAVMEYDAE